MSFPRFCPAMKRSALAAIAAALLVASAELAAFAAPAQPNANVAQATTGVATDFSAARRHRYYRRGNAAGAAFMGAVLGTMGAIIAEQQRREYYENYYAPYPYGGPYYYGRPYPYYGPRYYYPY
jgi:peptidoglycan/LPS O-acetylase OafA/YrhL